MCSSYINILQLAKMNHHNNVLPEMTFQEACGTIIIYFNLNNILTIIISDAAARVSKGNNNVTVIPINN